MSPFDVRLGQGCRAMQLTAEQTACRTKIDEFLQAPDPQVFCLQGLAGTGKSLLLADLAKTQPRAELLAPTGKAAAVLTRKSGISAETLHKFLYAPPEEDSDGNLVFNRKNCRIPGGWRGILAIIDEASMIDEKLAADIIETGARVIAAGDPGQLPPVNGEQYFTTPDFTLHEIHRQAAGSAIIRQAHAVRSGKAYESDGNFTVVDLAGTKDLLGNEWPNIVLCWRNETRHRVNQFVRRQRGIPILAPPQPGEPLMCLENHVSGMRNGEIFKVRAFSPSGGLELEDGPRARIRVPWFEWLHLGEKQPRRAASFALAYASTVHKAQGAEWPQVLVFDEFNGIDRARWLYTAITRGAEAVAIYRMP